MIHMMSQVHIVYEKGPKTSHQNNYSTFNMKDVCGCKHTLCIQFDHVFHFMEFFFVCTVTGGFKRLPSLKRFRFNQEHSWHYNNIT